MAVIITRTRIQASPKRCFDLARDVEVHCRTCAHTGERVVGGKAQGLLELGDTVTFEAVHLGVRQRLTAQIIAFERPRFFVDEMQRGAFRSLRHEHEFTPMGDATLMTDRMEFASPLGWLGALADALVMRRYMRRFLARRNRALKYMAEAAAR